MEELQSSHSLALFLAAVAALAIAHRVVLRLPAGIPRLIFILPILPIFFIIPWTIPVYHLRAILSFIFLWTVPSKLLLLCWDAGIDYPSSGFAYFATIVMMPIRVKGRKQERRPPCIARQIQFWWQLIAVIVILNIYPYRKGLPLWAIYVLYTCHMYLGLEVLLGTLARLATACFGVESDPQFNNPFMSPSLSEFWGRRWNLIVTTILRSTVYNPALLLLMRAEKHTADHSTADENNSFPPKIALNSQIPHHRKQVTVDIVTRNHQRRETDSDRENKRENKNRMSLARLFNLIASGNVDQQDPSPVFTLPPSTMDHYCTTGCRKTDDSNSDTGSKLCSIKSTESMQKAGMPIAHDSDNSKGGSKNCELQPQNGSKCRSSEKKNQQNAQEDGLLLPQPINSHPNPEITPENESIQKLTLKERMVSAAKRAAKVSSLVTFMKHQDADAQTYHKNITKNGAEMYEIADKPSLLPFMKHQDADAQSYHKNLTKKESNMYKIAEKPSLVAFMKHQHADAQSYHKNLTKKDSDMMYLIAEKPSLRARAVAMLATFAVSGLVHELIFYYINKSRATGEVTAFFILHGCATAAEVLLKKKLLAHLRLPRPLSIALTMAFLYVTAAWLFLPPLMRYGADINFIAEYQRCQSALLSSLFTKP